MQRFALNQFYLGTLRLWRYIQALNDPPDGPEHGLGIVRHLKDSQLKHDGERVAVALDFFRFPSTPNTVSRLHTFTTNLNQLTRAQMLLRARELDDAIYADSERVRLAVLRTDQDTVIADLRQIVLFGFSEAVGDVEHAGDCYRIDAFDACIFHLLRVLEHGLRKMAQTLCVPSYHAGTINMRDWGGLIAELETVIKALPRNTPEERIYKERMSEVATHFLFIKDVWRNVYFHTRNEPTTQEKASRFLGMTQEFMRLLRLM